MHQFTFHDPRHALYSMCQVFLGTHAFPYSTSVERVAPRGQETRELRNVTMTIRNTAQCLPVGIGRRFNSKLAAVETLGLIGGFADPDLLTAASPTFLKFTGGGVTGAYGPRLRDQMPLIIDALQRDPDTRQAHANIWDFHKDLEVSHGDRPCTTNISFLIRDRRLITSTYMRSQDIFLGWTYDAVMFSTLHETVANVLGVVPGPLVHTVQSLHMYERDVEKAEQILPPELNSAWQLNGFHGDSWDEVQEIARRIAYDDSFVSRTGTEDWFAANVPDTARGEVPWLI